MKAIVHKTIWLITLVRLQLLEPRVDQDRITLVIMQAMHLGAVVLEVKKIRKRKLKNPDKERNVVLLNQFLILV